MRFISMHDKTIVQIVPMVQEWYATGATQVVQQEVLCHFVSEGLKPHERELAMQRFAFRGLYQEMDEVSTVQPDYRIGLFDTVAAQRERGWPDEMRARVERALTAIAEENTYLLVAPKASVEPPWPLYDEYKGPPAKLAQKLLDEGHDLQRTLIYERESQNRSSVIEAIEQILAYPETPQLEEIVG
ncbi:MAG TPA: hypothetical protein VKD72_25685 [Gemmataceae bacterium]|nr:hypothetical protein [Gemmataceae bacterium]